MRPCLSRRAFTVGVVSCAACGEGTREGLESPGLYPVEASAPADAGPRCVQRDGASGWRQLALSDFPGLEVPGAAAIVQRPDFLLDALLIHRADGCFACVWRLCSHGACAVEARPSEGPLHCPCHGSRFDFAGAVLHGPATVPLRTFPVVREGDALWVYRPL